MKKENFVLNKNKALRFRIRIRALLQRYNIINRFECMLPEYITRLTNRNIITCTSNMCIVYGKL